MHTAPLGPLYFAGGHATHAADDVQSRVSETIDLVAVLAGRGSERRLAELVRVTGLGPAGDYALSPAGVTK